MSSSNYYGTEVGRHLSGTDRQYTSVVFAKDKPPIAEEFNLLTDTAQKARQEILQSQTASGFVSNPFEPKQDYRFSSRASNMFWLGSNESGGGRDDITYAHVNGWMVPVAGTRSEDGLWNAIQLPPPPDTNSGGQTNFVFLEVWKSQVSPDGEEHKPTEDEIYRFGNVEYGGTNVTNQILDPRFMIETSERMQIQYRLRVVNDVNPESAPHGFGAPNVFAQGPLDDPNTNFQYTNMKDELGDAGLWRAGEPHEFSEDGTVVKNNSDIPSVDGFVYAIPVCFVFRRAQGAWRIGQQNRAYDRNENAVSREDAMMHPVVELTEDLAQDEEDEIQVNFSIGETTFDEENGFIRINDEIIAYDEWTGQTLTGIERGARRTYATAHEEGSEVTHVSGHPFGLFSDQIQRDDVLDLRHVVNLGESSYDDLLKNSFFQLAQNELRSTWKRSDNNTKGLKHYNVDKFSSQPPNATGIQDRDLPDGFRKIFSDAATIQPNNLVVAGHGIGNVDEDEYTFNVDQGRIDTNNDVDWRGGDSLRIGLDQLQDTFLAETGESRERVRFIHPLEYQHKDHDPVRVWFGDTTPDHPDLPYTTVPNIVVLGKQPDDVPDPFLSGHSNIQFDGSTVDLGIDFSTDDHIDTLREQDAWIHLINEELVGPNRGAFKIVGYNAGTEALELETADGSSPGFATEEQNVEWRILLRACTEQDEDLTVVLTNDDPDVGGNQQFFLSFDVFYLPNQGMSRVPEEAHAAWLVNDNGTPYLRESTFRNVLVDTAEDIKKYRSTSMETYPHDRRYHTRIRNNQDIRTSVESTWAESYVDKGSKTVLFQPVQQAEVALNVSENDVTMSYATKPWGQTGGPFLDAGFGFNLTSGDDCLFVPKELLPPPGRIDVPFSSGDGTFQEGINLCFLVEDDGIRTNDEIVDSETNFVFNVDGEDPDPPGYNENLDDDRIICRLYDEGGVRGIQLPPHIGIAGLFALHDPDDPNTNLLRKDTDGRSMLIVYDEELEAHTFVVPEDVIDINLLDLDFSEHELEFDAAIFMFEDWSADLVRIHTHGDIQEDPVTVDMLVNGPCNDDDTFYQVMSRVPYQGNISGTMPTGSPDFRDYQPKRHADTASNMENLQEPIDQRETEWLNPVKVEILASMPFMTSLGTGRIAGPVVSGSYTDVGYVSQEGFPANLPEERHAKSQGLVSSTMTDEHGFDPVPGTIPDRLTGLTERLPLGLMANDHLFMGESFYGSHKRFWTDVGVEMEGFSDLERRQQLSKSFRRGLVVFSDGTSTKEADHVDFGPGDPDDEPVVFRTFRGGTLTVGDDRRPGGVFTVSGDRVYKDFPQMKQFEAEYTELIRQRITGDISSDSDLEEKLEELQAEYRQRFQIHGAVLFGIAFLVRTRRDEVDGTVHSYGDELQMMIATGASFGVDQYLDQLDEDHPSREVLDSLIQLHPSGLGEGRCAADRYRLEGRPLQKPSKVSDDIDFDLYRGSQPIGDIDDKC